MNKRTFGIAATVLATMLWGMLIIPERNLTDAGFSSLDIAFVRMGLTAVVLFVVLLLIDRKSLKIKLKDLWIFPIFGFMEMLSEAFIFYAMDHTSAALAVLLQMTSPYYIMLMAYFFFGEKITKRMAIASIIALVGCLFATGAILGVDRLDVLGIFAGIGSGVAYAAFVIGSRISMERDYTPQGTLFYTFLFGALFSIPLVDFEGITTAMSNSISTTGYVVSMAIFMTAVPYYLSNIAIRDIGASLTSIIELLEIVFAAFFELVVFGTGFDIMKIPGMILIFVAMIVFDEQSYNYVVNKLKSIMHRSGG